MIWPDAVQAGRRADPFTPEERAIMAAASRAIAHVARAGGRLSLKRADGSWFTVVEWGRILDAPLSFNLKEVQNAE